MLNIFKKIIGDKKEYKDMMARVQKMPEDYQYVYKKIQHYMWSFAAGSGFDMLKIHYELIDLFESGASEGKHVLDITGRDVAAFCDELLRNAKTYTANLRSSLNHDIIKRFGSSDS